MKIEIENRRIWSFLGFVALAVFTYFQMIGYIIPGMRAMRLLKSGTVNISHIGLVWVPIIAYLLFGTATCLLIGAFKKLRSFREGGLILCFILGFAGSLILTLLLGLTVNGACLGEILAKSVSGGLGVGLFFGIAMGLILEFTHRHSRGPF